MIPPITSQLAVEKPVERDIGVALDSNTFITYMERIWSYGEQSTITITTPPAPDSILWVLYEQELTYFGDVDDLLITSTNWGSTPLDVVNEWWTTARSYIPFTVLEAGDAVAASSLDKELAESSERPAWVAAMPTDARFYYLGVSLPGFTAIKTQYLLATFAPANGSEPSLASPATASATNQETTAPAYYTPPTDVPSVFITTLPTTAPSTTANSSFPITQLTMPSASSPTDEKSPSNHRLLTAILPAVIVMLMLFIGIVVTIFVFRRRRRRNSDDQMEAHPDTSIQQGSHPDYNAEPLFPHEPLRRMSKTTFTSDPRASHGTSSASGPQIPSLPELEGDPGIPEMGTGGSSSSPELEGDLGGAEMGTSSSDDDFGTQFSGLEDPFSDQVSPRNVEAETPGVSPSTYPLRDRLSHDSFRRQRAVQSVRSQGSERRSSVSEQELQRMVAAFDAINVECETKPKLRSSRSFEEVVRNPSADSVGSK